MCLERANGGDNLQGKILFAFKIQKNTISHGNTKAQHSHMPVTLISPYGSAPCFERFRFNDSAKVGLSSDIQRFLKVLRYDV